MDKARLELAKSEFKRLKRDSGGWGISSRNQAWATWANNFGQELLAEASAQSLEKK